MLAKKSEKTILFLKVLFLSSLTLLSRILTLVVLTLSDVRSFFEVISEVNKVETWSVFFTIIFKQLFTLNTIITIHYKFL